MSRGVDLSTLSSLSDDATLATLSKILSAEHNTHRSGRRSLVNNLLTAMQDAETLYAGSGEPTDKPQGKVYFDTAADVWKGYKTASGTPVILLDAALAYTADLSTAGTATFRLGGPIIVKTADHDLTSSADFTNNYTIPAGVIDRNGQYIHAVWWGTRSGAAGTFSLQPKFGSPLGTAIASTVSSITDWIIELWVIRTGSSSQKFAFQCTFNRDNTGSTTLVDTGTASVDLTGTAYAALNLSAISAGTVTNNVMIIEFGNY